MVCDAEFGVFDIYGCILAAGHDGLHDDGYGLLWMSAEPTEQ